MALVNCGKLLGRLCLQKSRSIKLTDIWKGSLSTTRPVLMPMSTHACHLSPQCYEVRFKVTGSKVVSTHRCFSTNKPPEEKKKADIDEKDMTVFQRFTKVYKEYGKTLIAVHVATSIVWYGGFYMLAKTGIDLLPLLIKLGLSEALQAKYAAAGDFLVAYIIYELAKPVRYLFTLAATRQAVRYMRNIGYLPELKPEDKLRNLAKDGRDNLKDKYQEQKDDMKEKYAEKKAKYKEKWHTVRHRRSPPHQKGLGSPLQKSSGIHRHHLHRPHQSTSSSGQAKDNN